MKRLSFLKRIAAARTAKLERRRVAQRQRMLRMEHLDSRQVMDGSAPTLSAIADVTVKAGSPLIIPLNASDTDSGPLTFSASSNNTTKLTTETPTTNRSLKLVTSHGEMWFELFEDKAPEITSKIIALVEAGKWNNTIFHRVISGFVIQGGDPNGNGLSDDGIDDFDDQFHLDLQHNSTGLLSMAKGGDDSNASQFFVTDNVTDVNDPLKLRRLDFNHSIFGKLVKGDDVREMIANVATNSSDKPTTDVQLISASIFTDDDNGVLFLKAPTGQTGTVQVTVTVADSDGNQAQRTFNVNIVADDANGAPFLNPIPAVFTTTGSNALIQLSSQDAEGDTRVYEAIKPSNQTVNYTLSVNASTGLVTVTPPAGFVGSFQVLVGVKQSTNANANDQYDTQLVTVNVRPLAPTLVLDAASDSGSSQSDGKTNAENLKFNIGGVTNAAIINLYRGNDLIETMTATGTTASITTTKFNTFPDGVYNMRVTQTVAGIESVAGTFTLTLDNTGPALVTPVPPTEAIATKPYVYDAGNAEEGQAGFKYSLVNAPAGASINETTGVITWTPTPAQVGSVTFGIKGTDAAGNDSVRTVNVSVADAPLVQFILKVTDSNGNVITQIANGQTFELRVFTKDLSPTNPNGVFSAYMDIEWDAQFAELLGQSTFGPAYSSGQGSTQGTRTPGLIDEIGTLQPSFTNSAGELLLFKQTFTAKKSGVFTFSSNEADVETNETTVNPPNHTVQIPNSRIEFGDVQLTVDSTVTAVTDTFNVDEDSTNQTLTPLQNDTVTAGTNAGLIITAVGAVSQVGGVASGTVTIAGDGKTLIFTPKADFFGAATFTYTVKNTDNSTSVGNITVQVQPKNDAPTANDDNLTMGIGVPGQFLNVLLNDSFAPDADEVLTIKSFTQGSQGGTIALGPGAKHLTYTPKAGFSGTETFTYTITDGNNGEDTATVNLTVTNTTNIPIAGEDALRVNEDSDATNFNPLTNDTAGANDATKTLTITAVQATSAQGGTVTVSTDGKTVNYKPKANFQGQDSFTYTVKDASGATTTGTVKVTVNNVNDAPTAVNDTFSVGKNQSKTLDVLANDKSDPDPTEAFTIESFSNVSNGGTIVISADKKSISYTPASGFTGKETFKYKIKDAGGLESEATVEVTVLNFIPGKISGRVFFDNNGDLLKQGSEVGLANITIKIEGTSSFDTDGISQTIVTDSQGRYTFDALPPGDYTITQVTMNGLNGTRYHAGTNGGWVNGASLKVTLGEGVESMYNDFVYDAPRSVGVLSTGLFASSARSGFLAAAAPGTNGHAWNSIGQGWANYTNLKLSLATDLKSVTITGTDSGVSTAAAGAKTATIPLSNAGKVKAIKQVGNTYTFQVSGTAAQIFGTSSGSGESGSSTNRTAGAASGESGSANLSSSDAALLAAMYADSTERTESYVAKTRGLSQSARSADFLFASSVK